MLTMLHTCAEQLVCVREQVATLEKRNRELGWQVAILARSAEGGPQRPAPLRTPASTALQVRYNLQPS